MLGSERWPSIEITWPCSGTQVAPGMPRRSFLHGRTLEHSRTGEHSSGQHRRIRMWGRASGLQIAAGVERPQLCNPVTLGDSAHERAAAYVCTDGARKATRVTGRLGCDYRDA